MTWTIITEDGLLMWREDIFATEQEARDFIAANPLTPNGTPQHAVPTELALTASQLRTEIGERHQREMERERVETTARLVHNFNVTKEA